MEPKGDIALIGLAVMGRNLILNMNDHGFTVVAYNRTVSKVDDFMNGAAKDTNIIGAQSIEEMVGHLKRPRRVMMLVKAGQPVDDFIDRVIPYLEQGDIIIDGGNSLYQDSIRRTKYLRARGLLFVGTGVSGGEEGARHGPSIMPGGHPDAWPHVKEIFQAISAKVDDGAPCCDWVGNDGAGHYVKMVHNGIEYGDMQLICEAYQMMKDVLGMSNDEMHEVFTEWNKGELSSYLIEITADILAFKDKDGSPLIDQILDTAGQKGTGKWTGIIALELGTPLTLIGESVFSRCLSSIKEERVEASKRLKGPSFAFKGNKMQVLSDIHDALYAAKIVSYAQGYTLLAEAAKEFNWKLNFGGIALIWRGGCIIRSVFLNKIKEAYDNNPSINNLLLDPFFKDKIGTCQLGWRRTASLALNHGIPIPAMTSALCYYDGYRTARLPANLLQAQRDYFGAHTYERLDQPRGEFFHTDWLNP